MKGVFIQAFGSLFSFSLFHVIRSFIWIRSDDSAPYWIQYLRSEQESVDLESEKVPQQALFTRPTYTLCWKRLFLPVVHSLFNIWGYGSLFATFYFLGLCKHPVNSGVVSSLFSSSLVFVAILFYFYFGQKMSLKGIGGIGLIVASICVISLSAETNSMAQVSSDKTVDEDEKNI